MKIVQLEYFCAVSRYHSITQAAQKLYVTQPAISNAIKELEKEFSIQLFTRNKNHLSLTREGEIFYQKANALLQTIHQTSSELLDLGQQTVPIRIGIPPLLSTVFFPETPVRFHKKYPDIPVELYEYGSIRAAELVQDETLDLALVNMNFYGLDKPNSFKILSDRIVFCVSGDHPLAEEKEVTMDMLQEESVILYSTDSVQNSTLNTLFDQLESKTKCDPPRQPALYNPKFCPAELRRILSLRFPSEKYAGADRPSHRPTHRTGNRSDLEKKGKYVNSSVEKFLSFTEELLR